MVKKDYEESVKERIKLINIFYKKYGNPVLVHAVDKKQVFKRILSQGIIMIPSNHKTKKRTLLSEKIIGTDDCIYLSLGFVYATAYDFKYNFLFDLELLKEMEYYWLSVNFQCFKAVVKYWEKYDKDYLEALGNKNKKCRDILDYYYFRESKNRARRLFKYWEIEEDFLDLIMNYKHKNKLMKIIRETKKKYELNYPRSERHALRKFNTDDTPEILSFKDLSLMDNSHFKGFYIMGEIPQDIKRILKKKYSGKILFDGKNISKIK